MIKKRSLLDKLGGKTTAQLPTTSVNSALGRSVGGYQPTQTIIKPILPSIVPTPVIPSPAEVSRDKGNPTLKQSVQQKNAKQSVVDAKLEKQTKQKSSDRAKMLERQLEDKYDINIRKTFSPMDYGLMKGNLKLDEQGKKQFDSEYSEYLASKERSNPFNAGGDAGFNILPTMSESLARTNESFQDVQSAKGYGEGRLFGGIGQQLAFNSVLGPGIASLTSKLLPKATPFVTETIKDVAIGTGTQLAEAPFDKPTATQFGANIAIDIALNALFGAVGKGLSKVDLSNLKTAKPSQVVGDVAEKLNVSIVEADKVVDDAIDFYVNKSGVADTKQFDQLRLEAPKTKDLSDVSNTLSSKLRAKQSDLYVNQFGVADTKPFDQLQLEAPKYMSSDASVSRLSEKVKAEASLHNANEVAQPKINQPQLDRPSEFSIGEKYPQLAKDFAREVPKPARPRIEPTLKPIDRPSDFAVKKPIYPTLDPKFAKERPSVLGTVNKTVDTVDNVASKVESSNRTMKFEPTLKPKNATVATEPIKPTLNPNKVEVKEPIDTRSKVLVDMPKKAKTSLFDTYDRIYQEVVSKNIPSERVGGKAKVQASNMNRASGSVEYNVFENQTDILGKDIGKSVVGIFSDVPESKKAELFDYALNYHNINRSDPLTYIKDQDKVLFNEYASLKKQIEANPNNRALRDRIRQFDNLKTEFDNALKAKPVFGETVTPEVSAKIIKDLETQNPKLAAKQKEITKYFKNIMDEWSVKSGLVSQETADLLAKMYPNYVPTYRAKDLPKNMSFGGQNVAQILKKAKGGDSSILPIDQMMVAMTDRTIKNARKNELMNTWAEIYQSDNNEMAKRYIKDLKFSDEKEVVDDILDVGKLLDSEPVIKGDSYVVNFYRDGKPAQMTVNRTMYESLKNTTSDDAINQIANIVKKYATDPMKATITGYNPLFTASNIMRDIPTALTFSSDPLNMSKQLPDAVKEMLTNGEKFRLFKAMGGTREGLIGSNGKFKVPSLKESKSVMDAVKKANPIAKVGEVNNFVETLPRFTEFLNVLEKTGDPALAVYRSAELTTDFSRHGNLTKLVDSFVPYLNPSVQGIDRFFRGMTKSPLKMIAKGATVITIPTIILDQVNKNNEAYNEMSPRERNLYFNIPFEDSEGNQKFIRIPKSRELGFVFSSLYEFAARLSRGQEVTGKEVAESIKENFTPVDITSSTIFTPGIRAWNQIKNPDAYETNYFGSLIVPESQRNYSPGEQYDINSSGIAKAIGQQFNVSPFVIDYLMNSYTGIIGQTLAPIGADKKSTIFAPFEKKFINDPVFKSNTVTEFYEALDEATKAKNDFYRKNDLDSDKVSAYEKNKTYGEPELKKALELKKQASLLNAFSRDLSDLRKEQKELKTSSDKNREKLVRELQIKMNELAKKALEGEK